MFTNEFDYSDIFVYFSLFTINCLCIHLLLEQLPRVRYRVDSLRIPVIEEQLVFVEHDKRFFDRNDCHVDAYLGVTNVRHGDFDGTDVVEIDNRVVEALLHDREVLVKLVHVSGTMLVQMAAVRLLPILAFHLQGQFQRLRQKEDWSDTVGRLHLEDAFF